MTDKKELKKQYKQTLQPMGIYQIRNKSNGKIFIGSGLNLPGKINSNKFQLKLGSHKNREIQADFIRLGEENFTFDVLDSLEPREDMSFDYARELEVLEEMWLDKLQPYGDRGYNKQKT